MKKQRGEPLSIGSEWCGRKVIEIKPADVLSRYSYIVNYMTCGHTGRVSHSQIKRKIKSVGICPECVRINNGRLSGPMNVEVMRSKNRMVTHGSMKPKAAKKVVDPPLGKFCWAAKVQAWHLAVMGNNS